MEHSLHLAAKHFIEAVAPCPSEKCGANGTAEDAEDNEDDEDDDLDLEVVDSLGKAIALVKQVSFPWIYSHS